MALDEEFGDMLDAVVVGRALCPCGGPGRLLEGGGVFTPS